MPNGVKLNYLYIFSLENHELFLLQENIELGSKQFPLKTVDQLRIIYQDDLLLKIERCYGLAIHFLAIKWALCCISKFGVKVSNS